MRQSIAQNPIVQFLSTLSLRRATFSRARFLSMIVNFYPRSPCGERHSDLHAEDRPGDISIHALLAESDAAADGLARLYEISIHALLAESDLSDGRKEVIGL